MLTQKLCDRIDSVCEPGDRLTASLQELLKLPKIHKLESREQLGLVLTATYLRSPDFAAYLVKEASTRQSVSLLTLVHNYFRHTRGVGVRKTYLPTRVIGKAGKQKQRPNMDLAALRLSGLLAWCGQFLDGSLDSMLVNADSAAWSVDLDLQLGCPGHCHVRTDTLQCH